MNERIDLSTALEALRSNPAGDQGRLYWRSLEELADSEAFQALMLREFPEQASVWPDALSRRRFLGLMGASLALGGLSGCSIRPAPSKGIVPYVRAPEEMLPGKPLFYATAMALGGAAVGLLVESHLGRPTKIEGNPDHPASLGATDVFHQAAVLTLYDPDRSKTVLHLGQTTTWEAAARALRDAMRTQRQRRGAGLRLLTETIVSPTLGKQIEDLLQDYPDAKWHQYEPLHRDMAYRGAQLALGTAVSTRYDFSRADVVLSLDADFLTSGPGSLRYTADFMSRRRVRTTEQDAHRAQMNRLYVAETAVTCTGAKADHRLALGGRALEQLALAIAGALGVGDPPARSPQRKWVAAVAKDLAANRGRSLVLAGDRQPAAVHLLAHALNDRLGNVGKTVFYTDPVEVRPTDQTKSLEELVDDIKNDRAELLVILGGNPVYTAPADLEFAKHLDRVALRVQLGLFQDETSRLCHWHLPEAHFLEAWSDGRAYDGTVTIAQPLIEPLYEGRSAHEVVALLADQQSAAGQEIVRAYWRDRWQQRQDSAAPTDDDRFDDSWQAALHDGLVADTAFSDRTVELKSDWQLHLPVAVADDAQDSAEDRDKPGLEIAFQADPTLYDGRFANNGWLQELPKSITKLTWGNAAIMSPATAQQLGLSMGSYAHGGEHGGYHMPVVELRLGERSLRAPLWIMPGHAEHAVTVYLGFGREAAGTIGGTGHQTVGFDAYRLRTAAEPWFTRGLEVMSTSDVQLVACTQQHHLMENRDVVRSATLDQYRAHPGFAADRDKQQEHDETHQAYAPLTLYESYDYEPPKHKWGMVIDLNTCTGCNACVVACQAENNIPVVGKEQVAAGREMHWLRIDRYTRGSADQPQEFYFQPLPCMHCEHAPCEYVCPVEATVHSAEGLNDMVYNRCVGTRFCSNNCPYKVRRFNFLAFGDFDTETRRMQYNPDVTVRSRGVMEKCTYCVQRLRQAEIAAQVENRSIADGEVLTACQAVCPAQAIVFGDLNDPQSKVKQWKDSPLEYGLLADQNTRPRTTYLAAVRNPNPELEVD